MVSKIRKNSLLLLLIFSCAVCYVQHRKIKKIKIKDICKFSISKDVELGQLQAVSICICMAYTEEIANYSVFSEKINSEYAKKHGYDFVVFKNLNQTSRAPLWNKISAVKKCLEKKRADGTKEYEYVFWIDSDAFFNFQEKRLENFIDSENNLFFCCDNGSTIVNTGCFLVKNTPWSEDFLTFWWTAGDNSKFGFHKFHEQQILDSIICGDMMGINSKLKIYDTESFNSLPLKVTKFRKGWDQSFIVHLMATSSKTREEILKRAFQKICRF